MTITITAINMFTSMTPKQYMMTICKVCISFFATNLKGIFLHVLADSLGSIGVIISSILVEWYGLHIADPICSLCISVLIFTSVLPLLRRSASILLQCSPRELDEQFKDILRKVHKNTQCTFHLLRYNRSMEFTVVEMCMFGLMVLLQLYALCTWSLQQKPTSNERCL